MQHLTVESFFFQKNNPGGIIFFMREFFSNNRFRQMVFIILVGILIIGFITYISKAGSETLTDYAAKNPESAYAEGESSWKDAYISGQDKTDPDVSVQTNASSAEDK